MRSAPLVFALTLVACDAEVHPPSEASLPVPECTWLVPRSEELVVPESFVGQLVAIDGADVGLLYAFNDDGAPGSIRSRRLLDPFGAWPPSLGPEAVHRDSPGLILDAVGRADGTFVLRQLASEPGTEYSIGAFGREGAWPTRAGRPMLEPSPGVGVYWHHDGELQYYATLDAEEPVFLLPLALPESELNSTPDPAWVHGLDGTGRLVVRGVDGFTTITGNSLSPFTPLPADDPGSSPAWLLPSEAGGFWYARQEHPAVEIQRLGADEEASPITLFEDVLVGRQRAASPWGAGRGVVAVAEHYALEGGTALGFELIITDGEHQTKARAHDADAAYSVVSSPDGASILVGVHRQGFVIRRFDCLSLD
jgi:hypothetical protein